MQIDGEDGFRERMDRTLACPKRSVQKKQRAQPLRTSLEYMSGQDWKYTFMVPFVQRAVYSCTHSKCGKSWDWGSQNSHNGGGTNDDDFEPIKQRSPQKTDSGNLNMNM